VKGRSAAVEAPVVTELYRERLVPPLGWWLLLALAAVCVAAAAAAYLGLAWGVGAALVCLAVFGGLLWSGSVDLRVDTATLRAGRACIEHRYLAGCRPLDRAATQRRTGPEADARAYLVVRPYVPTAVEVTLNDPDDAVPYWLISTRRPEALCAALHQAGVAGVTA
jgi:hypothetical protein